jgi:hypothetical protein
MMSTRSTLRLGTILSLALAACDRPADSVTGPAGDRLTPRATPQTIVASSSIEVANVEDLYTAVNEALNEGAAITLAPGDYVLSAIGPAGARPNGGRLELQRDMSLYGTTDDPSAVRIDASHLAASAFNTSFGRSAPIRIGRGSNSIEWLTVLGNSAAAGSIATDLPGTLPTRITVAHVVANGSSRGVDVRNVGVANAGRRIDAEIVDNDFTGPSVVVGMSEGIRLVNFVDADRGLIVATLNGNRVHGFQIGCIIANNRSSDAVVHARSSGDRFFGNALGCLIAGGLSQGATGVANKSTTTFEAHGSAFVDNGVAISGFPPGGISVIGGRSLVKPNVANDNTVTVSLWGTKVSDNVGVDFEAFGALFDLPVGVAGTYNHAIIELHGVSKQIKVIATASRPTEAAGTNTVSVQR